MLTEIMARWAAYSRWVAFLGTATVLVCVYATFQPARGQDKAGVKAPPKPAAESTKPGADATKRAGAGTLDSKEADRLAEAAIAAGEQAKKETKAPETQSGEGKGFNIFEVVWEGRIHMWAVFAILIVSMISVTAALERLFGLRRSKILPSDLVAGLRAMAAQKGGFDPRQAYRLCNQYPSSAAVVIKAMLKKAGRSLPEVDHALLHAAEREASRQFAGVRWQNLAFNVAPMLGLAGTVQGIILAFYQTANLPTGGNKMAALATGIYAALICTFAGLVVAIPAGILAHVYEGRILKLFRELQDVADSLVPLLERFEGKSRGGKAAAPEGAAIVEAAVALNDEIKLPSVQQQ